MATLKPYEKFAEMIDRDWDGIVAYCRLENKISLGFVEGLNNKIRVIQRRAYGWRNEEYLRLKILTCMLPTLYGTRPSDSYFVDLISCEQGTTFSKTRQRECAASLWTCRFAWTTQAHCPNADSDNAHQSGDRNWLKITHTTAR